MQKIKLNTLFLVVLMGLAACSDSDTSVDNVEVTQGDVPSEYVGTYVGTITGEAEADDLPLERSFTEDITITVSADNMITFSGDDPDEVFTTEIGSNGGFNGQLEISDDNCSGTINVSGTVDGNIASGNVGGNGVCEDIDASLTGTFSATKQ